MGRSKKDQIPIMKESGQTDADRRALRTKQRKLFREIHSNEDADPASLETIRQENNKLFNQVRYAREAVLDGDNFEGIAHLAARQADSLVSSSRFDVSKVIRKLQTKCRSSSGVGIDWQSFGKACASAFNSCPRAEFMVGPIDKEHTVKQRVVRDKKRKEVDSDVEEETPEEQLNKNDSKAKNRLTAVEKHLKSVDKALQKHSAEVRQSKRIKRGDVNLVKFAFNPKSFTQTVENLFQFAFLVKDGRAAIKVDENKNPIVYNTLAPTGEKQPKQAIIALSKRDWKKLIQKHSVNECLVPDRS